jgi:pimeloyl-ACP methyl ester carboxylesterase
MPYSNGQFYRCYDGGAGASSLPTILLHGLGGSHLSWPAVIRRLPGLRMIALDLPGHGASETPACTQMDCQIAALRQFLDALSFSQVNLVGHSMGAMIALAYASRYPQQIHKLSLLSIGLQLPYTARILQYFSQEVTKEKGIGLLMERGFQADFPKVLRRKLLEPLHNTRTSLLHADAQVSRDLPRSDQLRDAAFPIQLISGKDDQLVPPDGVQQLAMRLRKSKLHEINNCGHFVIFEQEGTVRELLLAFLQDQRPQ